jgi:cytochrome c oxidase assembly protein subunit 15
MQKNFRKIAKTSLVIVYLVIIAGAIVRVTGSGMGCPDWPRCYGYYIPPTTAEEVEWKPQTDYRKGQAIILNEQLYMAKTDFLATSVYEQENWELYTKHNYAIFNPWHTWIEYINRLVTVLLGIPILILLFLSFRFYKKDKVVTILTVLTILVLGIQAVLGKIVVDTNLKPTMISVHMFLALVLMLMLIYLVHRTSEQKTEIKYDKNVAVILVLVFIASLAQIFLGIQVRQFIDIQIDTFGMNMQQKWLQDPSISFYVHRSFSIMVVLLNLFLFYRIKKLSLGYSKITWVLLLITLEVLTGVAMNYLDFPVSSQPLHLVLASLLLGVQFYLILEALKSKRSVKTL